MIVEAETNPTAKLVPGDLLLAALVRRRFAEMYPRKETGLGRPMRSEPPPFKWYDDRRAVRQFIYPDERNVITGDEIGTLNFLLFTESNRDYLQGYMDLFNRGFRGLGPPFASSECFSVGRHSRREVERKVRRTLASL